MIRILLLIPATIALAVTMLAIFRSSDYAALIQSLTQEEHPLKGLYCIGFFLSGLPLFKLRGNLERELKRQSRLYWDNVYYEYYAYLTWAQFLTYAVIVIGIGFSLSSLLPSALMFLSFAFSVLMIIGLWDTTISKMKDANNERREACEYEFTTMVSKLALLVNSGMISREAWFTIANSKEGPLYDLMKRSCHDMDNGMSEYEAILRFGTLTDSSEIKKFASTMVQSLERGTSNLSEYLLGQTSELWLRKKQLALQRGEIAAGKLIIPIGIMFGGIILIIVTAALQSISL